MLQSLSHYPFKLGSIQKHACQAVPVDITFRRIANSGVSPVFLFALTLFCSASLMFVLQPMFAKALLPLLGGSASVWNTCMVFYQSTLFLGYLYAHLLTTRVSFGKRPMIHALLLTVSLFFLPIGIPENSRPPASDNPSLWLLLTLITTIGIPFFILSTTSPLLQKWFSGIGHHTSGDPYYLSMASNAGSLIALLSYPLLLEPSIGLSGQQQFWSGGFLVLLGLVALCMRHVTAQYYEPEKPAGPSAVTDKKTGLKIQIQWLILAFVPSSLLLGTTNFISIDIATVPLLWVIPLALYLLSFILVFSRYGAAIHKKLFLLQPWVTALFLVYFFSNQKLNSFLLELVVHLFVFFISIMVCHGELAKKRPATRFLTQYYLIMSFGGMLGGVFNSFIAPLIFSSIYEYPIMIVFALLLNPVHNRVRLRLRKRFGSFVFCTYVVTFAAILFNNLELSRDAILLGLSVVALMSAAYFFFKKTAFYFPLLGMLAVSCAATDRHADSQLLHQSRNFYGVLSVRKVSGVKTGDSTDTVHEIYSGTTRHGLQVVSDRRRQCTPNGYYSSAGPLGSIFSDYDWLNTDWRVGVIGLGAGEMAGYAKKSQHWTFFELDPAVVELATNPTYFTFLKSCIDHYDIEIGDARITLEKQPFRYNLLVIDAFTSDAIPTHLLTREAIKLYFSRMKPNGLLVFHISNRYLELKKVLADHAQRLGLVMRLQEFRPSPDNPLVYRSDWAVMARSDADLEPLLRDRASLWQPVPHYRDTRSWTDDFTSIINVWK